MYDLWQVLSFRTMLFVALCCFLLGFHSSEGWSALKDLPSEWTLTVREGLSIEIECNVSAGQIYEHIVWYDSKGNVLNANNSVGERVTVNQHTLNITSVSFEDRGKYTCVAWSSGVIFNYTVTLRVSYTHSGLGLYFVIVCVVAFVITMILNLTRLCMINTHLRKTERAINEFFLTDGAEKLQKAVEIAKRIPIVTSAKTLELAKVTQFKTLELAKVTQFKTLELAKQMEELARSIPLPPLILHCGMLEKEVELDVVVPTTEPAEPCSEEQNSLCELSEN